MSGHQVALRALGHAAWPSTGLYHRLVDVTDVGKLATFLVSEAARHITAVIPADGGQQLLA